VLIILDNLEICTWSTKVYWRSWNFWSLGSKQANVENFLCLSCFEFCQQSCKTRTNIV